MDGRAAFVGLVNLSELAAGHDSVAGSRVPHAAEGDADLLGEYAQGLNPRAV